MLFPPQYCSLNTERGMKMKLIKANLFPSALLGWVGLGTLSLEGASLQKVRCWNREQALPTAYRDGEPRL